MSFVAPLLLMLVEEPPVLVMMPPPEIQACYAKHRNNDQALNSCIETQRGAGDDKHRDASDPQSAETMSLDALERDINRRHPMDYMMLAARLFYEVERKDDGLFWFYAWQLRQRIRLACYPDLDPSAEPALFGAIFVTNGPDFNKHAGSDPDKWAAVIDRVLAWDAANPSQYERDATCTAQRDEVRGGLEELAEIIRKRRDEILAGVEFDPG